MTGCSRVLMDLVPRARQRSGEQWETEHFENGRIWASVLFEHGDGGSKLQATATALLLVACRIPVSIGECCAGAHPYSNSTPV